jgi:predicted HicB family RNase H-like nuclease
LIISNPLVPYLHLINRLNKINFNFIVIRFSSASDKAFKVYLLLKNWNDNKMQYYLNNCAEQNEESNIPHFDIY